jgi:hypothetical protein
MASRRRKKPRSDPSGLVPLSDGSEPEPTQPPPSKSQLKGTGKKIAKSAGASRDGKRTRR